MKTYKTDAVVDKDGNLVIVDVPFDAGEKLKVILLHENDRDRSAYGLRGEPVRYHDPLESVGKDDWETSS